MKKVKWLSLVLVILGTVGGGALAQRNLQAQQPHEQSPAAPTGLPSPRPGSAEGQGSLPPARLQNGQVPLGSLGYPLGDYLTVEGTREPGRGKGFARLLVDTINGKKLKEPIAIGLGNLIHELPENTRIIIKGYETGEMGGGPVPAVIAWAKEKGEELASPQKPWQWFATFIVLSAVEPKLEIKEPKGFMLRERELPQKKGAPAEREPSAPGAVTTADRSSDFKVEAQLCRDGPRLTLQVVQQPAASNWHYDLHVTTADGLDQHFRLRNGQPVTKNDIRLADVTGDGFLDIMIVGGKDHRGQDWLKTWLYDVKAKKYKWINDQ